MGKRMNTKEQTFECQANTYWNLLDATKLFKSVFMDSLHLQYLKFHTLYSSPTPLKKVCFKQARKKRVKLIIVIRNKSAISNIMFMHLKPNAAQK